ILLQYNFDKEITMLATKQKLLNNPTSLLEKLNSYIGKHISKICPSMIAKINSQNHCAHFVSHALDIHKPGTASCKTFTLNDKVNDEVKNSFIRVNEIFNNCYKRGPWDPPPAEESFLLIFATRESNINSTTTPISMNEHPVKHIGIYHKGQVWHYSNSSRMIKKDPIYSWIDMFTRSYKDNKNPKNKVLFFYGLFK
ncbi:MAG: hypothetical protein KAU21_06290, partial [Gammaproteobacteria bacterium]|nr:hypothetical protein [Gammaproteobacteria bacterium]